MAYRQKSEGLCTFIAKKMIENGAAGELFCSKKLKNGLKTTNSIQFSILFNFIWIFPDTRLNFHDISLTFPDTTDFQTARHP